MIRLFCLVYGERFVDLFERISARSLMQPNNLAALPPDVVVSLYCDAASVDRATEIASWLGRVEVTVIDPSRPVADMLHDATIAEIEKCIRLDASLIMTTPDMFWGDGSVRNLLSVARGQRVCVGAVHPRVNRDEFLRLLPDGPISNAELVSLAFRTLHQTWADADVDKPMTNTWVSGATLRKLSDGLYAVQSMLPTIFLARFTQDDLRFFMTHEKRGLWDHYWPALLVAQQRQRLIGSSDAFFGVEMTAHDQNLPPVNVPDPAEPDKYRGSQSHHPINKGFVSIWRKAEAA